MPSAAQRRVHVPALQESAVRRTLPFSGSSTEPPRRWTPFPTLRPTPPPRRLFLRTPSPRTAPLSQARRERLRSARTVTRSAFEPTFFRLLQRTGPPVIRVFRPPWPSPVTTAPFYMVQQVWGP